MAPARAILLLITVWLFAAAWSGDHPIEPATAAAEPSPLSPATSGLDLGPLVKNESLAPFGLRETRFATAESVVTSSSRWLNSLPAGITPGTFLVVHGNGQTERLTVDTAMLQRLGHDSNATPQATHTMTVDGAPLVLVRVQSPRAVIAEGDHGRRRM